MPTTRPNDPSTDLDARYGEPEATAIPWEQVQQQFAAAQVYWLSTVRPDGRPHVTSLLAVWHDGAPHICSTAGERKVRNLAGNPHVVLATGTPQLRGGTDIVVEGRAERVTDRVTLQALADAWEGEYGSEWHVEVNDEGFDGADGVTPVFRIEPTTAFAFGKQPYSQTRYRFGTAPG